MQASFQSAVSLKMPQSLHAKDAPSAASTSTVCSTEILRGQRERDIAHNGSVYRLQVTRLGKLILTK